MSEHDAADGVTVRESPIHGLGVFALVNFATEQVILAIDDSRVVTEKMPLRPEKGEYAYHCDYLADGLVVLLQYPERHINHSCTPNSYVQTYGSMRYVIALRDIAAGEEITNDYCINGGGDTMWHCNCGSPGCRRQIHSDFFHLPIELQLAYLPLLDDWFLEERAAEVAMLRQLADK
jgi:uncharacterized protein